MPFISCGEPTSDAFKGVYMEHFYSVWAFNPIKV